MLIIIIFNEKSNHDVTFGKLTSYLVYNNGLWYNSLASAF